MWRVLLVASALAFGCSKQTEEGPPPDHDTAPPVPAAEVKRGQDACKAYVEKVCACATDEARKVCPLAKALPDALDVGVQVSTSPDSKRRDVLQANDMVRKTIKECIEQAAKLPSLGC